MTKLIRKINFDGFHGKPFAEQCKIANLDPEQFGAVDKLYSVRKSLIPGDLSDRERIDWIYLICDDINY